jgi:transcriptional regulator with XRE-family HTH domain
VSGSAKYDEVLLILGDNVARYRKEKRLTQREVAFACGMEEQNYRRIEKSLTNPTLKTLIRISEVFNVEVTDLLLKKEA